MIIGCLVLITTVNSESIEEASEVALQKPCLILDSLFFVVIILTQDIVTVSRKSLQHILPLPLDIYSWVYILPGSYWLQITYSGRVLCTKPGCYIQPGRRLTIELLINYQLYGFNGTRQLLDPSIQHTSSAFYVPHCCVRCCPWLASHSLYIHTAHVYILRGRAKQQCNTVVLTSQ